MSRFYVPPEAVKGNEIFITGMEAHHILDVMRLKKTDKVVTFDGTGREYTGFIKDVKRKSLTVEITETRGGVSNKGNPEITIIQAITKKEKMDYIVEKATELGVNSIMPVVAARTIPEWDEPKKKKQADRWQAIAKEASKQCGRPDVPVIQTIRPFKEAVRDLSGYGLMLIAALDDDSIELKEALRPFKGGKVAIAIGPEGDFTSEEVECAKGAGFKLVSLGSRVLKSDTAGLAVLAIMDYEFAK